jgi:hypothetical protein
MVAILSLESANRGTQSSSLSPVFVTFVRYEQTGECAELGIVGSQLSATAVKVVVVDHGRVRGSSTSTFSMT